MQLKFWLIQETLLGPSIEGLGQDTAFWRLAGQCSDLESAVVLQSRRHSPWGQRSLAAWLSVRYLKAVTIYVN